VAGENQQLIRQGQETPGDAVEKLARIASRLPAVAAVPDQQAVAGENPVAPDQGQAVRRMARGEQHLQLVVPFPHQIAFFQEEVCAAYFRGGGPGYPGAGGLAQPVGGGKVVAVQVGVHHIGQMQTFLRQKTQVEGQLAQHRVHQNGLAAGAGADQVGEGGAGLVQQLAENLQNGNSEKRGRPAPI